MATHLYTLLRYYCFWLVFFFFERALFIGYYFKTVFQGTWSDVLGPFYHGLRLDCSMAAYVSLLPLLIYLTKWVVPKMPLNPLAIKIYTYFFIVLFSILSIANLLIYREWGSKLNYRALDFGFSSPGEAMASSLSSPIAFALTAFVLLTTMGVWMAQKICVFQIPAYRPKPLKKGVLAFGLLSILFLCIRGGWQLTPINQSMSYFSQKPIANHASVNTFWNLMHDVSKNINAQNNPYRYLSTQEAEAIVRELYQVKQEKSTPILRIQKPNVVVIILESFTADVVKRLGGETNIAPELEKVIQEGLLFENIYASGDRTDKGLIAILSGFPSQAVRSIIKEESKQEKLPALSQNFKQKRYHTSFYYGGESEFFGLKSYVLFHQFEHLVDKSAFRSEDMNSKWGAYDEHVFNHQLSELKNTPQPFFSTLLTLTNHEPFELPRKGKFAVNDVRDQYRNTAAYTDSCLGAYFKEAKKQAWYHNTLFVIVADHGHRLPADRYESWHPNRYRIPLLFTGGALKNDFKGKKNTTYGSQTDIANTLLTQLGWNSKAYLFSKDLLNASSANFSFYDWDNGFGMATPTQTIAFDNVGKTLSYEKNTNQGAETKRLEKTGKAYIQTVYKQYLAY